LYGRDSGKKWTNWTKKVAFLMIFPVNSLYFRELPRRFAKIYQRRLPSLLQSPYKFKIPPFLGVFLIYREVGSNANCLALRRDSKPATMSEFEVQFLHRKAKTVRAGPRKITVR
jgi:hypothetical protein